MSPANDGAVRGIPESPRCDLQNEASVASKNIINKTPEFSGKDFNKPFMVHKAENRYSLTFLTATLSKIQAVRR